MNKKYLIEDYRHFYIYFKKGKYYLFYKMLYLCRCDSIDKLKELVDESYDNAIKKGAVINEE